MGAEDGEVIVKGLGRRFAEDEATKFNAFVYAVFVAVVLGAGVIIWQLVAANSALDKRVTVLEYKCPAQPVSRGAT